MRNYACWLTFPTLSPAAATPAAAAGESSGCACTLAGLASTAVRVCVCRGVYRGKDATGPSDYYSLEALLFLLKNVKLPHPLYVTRASVSWSPALVHEALHVLWGMTRLQLK